VCALQGHGSVLSTDCGECKCVHETPHDRIRLVSQADWIVSEEIPYKNIGLPAHIVEHVGLHDRKTLAPTESDVLGERMSACETR
jgi:hypothetical protein